MQPVTLRITLVMRCAQTRMSNRFARLGENRKHDNVKHKRILPWIIDTENNSKCKNGCESDKFSLVTISDSHFISKPNHFDSFGSFVLRSSYVRSSRDVVTCVDVLTQERKKTENSLALK